LNQLQDLKKGNQYQNSMLAGLTKLLFNV